MANKDELLQLISELDDDQLLDFADEMLKGFKVSSRAKPETIREKMIAFVEGSEEAQDEVADTPEVEEVLENDGEHQGHSEADTEPKAQSGVSGQKRLKNIKNGRIFAYNKQLAKCPHIVEV